MGPRLSGTVESTREKRRLRPWHLAVCLGCVGALGCVPTAFPDNGSPKRTVIEVVAGKPTEFAFTLSRFSQLPPGTFVFRIRNAGTNTHNFVLCEDPVKNPARNSCSGYQSRELRPGESTTITITSIAEGIYEFLSTNPGDAVGGMKGLLGVGLAVKEPHVKPAPIPVSHTPTPATSTPISPVVTTNTTTTTQPEPTTAPQVGGYICKQGHLIQGVSTPQLCQGTQGDVGGG
jgi:hypothetical protein